MTFLTLQRFQGWSGNNRLSEDLIVGEQYKLPIINYASEESTVSEIDVEVLYALNEEHDQSFIGKVLDAPIDSTAFNYIGRTLSFYYNGAEQTFKFDSDSISEKMLKKYEAIRTDD